MMLIYITRDKLEEALMKMKDDKVLGCDALPIELIKSGNNILRKILKIFNKVWREETIPQ